MQDNGRVCVLVPYRGDDGGPRDMAWEFMRVWWGREHPTYAVVEGGCRPGPWCKAEAVADALRHTSPGDTLIISDCDVLCDGVGPAVAAVSTGTAAWAVPHHRVNRLTLDATRALYAGGGLPAQPPPPSRRLHHQRDAASSSPQVERSYTGIVGGGLVVLPRALYERVPLDPRFTGYGQEDTSWGLALRHMAGEPMRGRDPLWHLWHPPQERSKVPGIGSPESLALYHRYVRALTPDVMAGLLAEIGGL